MVYLFGNMGLKVHVVGSGTVAVQLILTGPGIAKGQLVNIELN